MPITFATLPRVIRAGSIRTLPVALTLLMLAGPPRSARAATGPDLAGLIPTLNRICSDLSRSREELRSGMLDADQFSERVLTLFVDADSMREIVEATPPAARWVGGPFFAADHSLRYLIDSLRENYVGIVAGNGLDFAAADQALQAAEAWRSGIVSVAANAESRGVDLGTP
jgi:hypothetical protein